MNRWQMQQLLGLLDEQSYRTADSLAEMLGVSEKTTRSRLKELDENLKACGAAIEAKPRYGYRLQIMDEEAYRRWSVSDGEAAAIPETMAERVRYLLQFLLRQDGYVKLDDLSQNLYVSRATVTACIRAAEEKLQIYGIRLERKPGYGIRILGTEFQVRRCLKEILLRDNWEGAPETRRQELQRLADILLEGLSRNRIHISEIALENFVEDLYVEVRRIRQGRYISLPQIDLNALHPAENELVQHIADSLEKHYGISCPPDERKYVALHLKGMKDAGNDCDFGNFVIVEEIDRLVVRMLDAVYQQMNLDFRGDFDLRMSLNQHMVALDIRMRYDIPMDNPLLEHIRKNYATAFAVAIQAGLVLRDHYGKEISQEELAYLALIFALAVEQRAPREKNRILIVCGFSRGSSRLLKHQVEQEFREYLEKVYTCELYALPNFDFSKVDYILSTVPIPYSIPKPIQQIGLFLEKKDIDSVRSILESGKKSFLQDYYRPEHFLSGIDGETPETALRQMCDAAVRLDGYPPQLYDLVMQREQLMPTDFGNGVAIPHPMKALSEKSNIYVAALPTGISWSRQQVRLVILMVIGKGQDERLQNFYQSTLNLISDGEAVEEFCGEPTWENWMHLIQGRGKA